MLLNINLPDHFSEAIAQDVIDVYGQMAVAKVAHSEHLKGLIPSQKIEDELRSDAALTMALLGLMGAEAVIAPRIGGKYRKRKSAVCPERHRIAHASCLTAQS